MQDQRLSLQSSHDDKFTIVKLGRLFKIRKKFLTIYTNLQNNT